jgi:hypothetical protein
MMSATGDIGRADHTVDADPPAASGVAVEATQQYEQGADQRDITDDAAPKQVPGTRSVIEAECVKEPAEYHDTSAKISTDASRT